jgi:hypothetical protein
VSGVVEIGTLAQKQFCGEKIRIFNGTRVVNEEPTKPTVRIAEIDHESFQAESGNIYFTILLENDS